MDWFEVVITTDSEMVDIVVARLMDFGVEAVEIIDDYENLVFLQNNPKHWDYIDDSLMDKVKGKGIIRFHLPMSAGAEAVSAISAGLAQSGYNCTVTSEIVDDTGWLNEWKKHYKPFKIGQNIMIVPEWEDYTKNENDLVFIVNPGHVFGTGLHQSTKMVIEALEAYVKADDKILDIGCGSGILAIIGLLLGADTAFAIDMDEDAVGITLENGRLNGIGERRLEAACANLLDGDKIAGEGYDIICANIISDVVIRLAPIVMGLVAAGGLFISSGIILERADEVKQAIIAAGFEIIEIKTLDEWCAIVAARSNA